MKNAGVDEFVTDLRRVFGGELGEHDFRAKYMHASGPAFLPHIWDGLQHLLADADIRSKDQGYRQMQEQELERLIGLLQEGAAMEQLRRITFLSGSKR